MALRSPQGARSHSERLGGMRSCIRLRRRYCRKAQQGFLPGGSYSVWGDGLGYSRSTCTLCWRILAGRLVVSSPPGRLVSASSNTNQRNARSAFRDTVRGTHGRPTQGTATGGIIDIERWHPYLQHAPCERRPSMASEQRRSEAGSMSGGRRDARRF